MSFPVLLCSLPPFHLNCALLRAGPCRVRPVPSWLTEPSQSTTVKKQPGDYLQKAGRP